MHREALVRIFRCVCCDFKVPVAGPFRDDLPPNSLAALGLFTADDCPRCKHRAELRFAGSSENFVGVEPPIPTFNVAA
jgi:hypothetical protein